VKRRIYYYDKDGISFTAEDLKSQLRSYGVEVIDVRTCKYVEVDFAYSEENEKTIKSVLGEPLFTDCSTCSFEELFFDFRFWESHEVLEKKWKEEKDTQKKKYMQALILVSASLIKYCKGQVNVSDQLLSKALSLISELPEEFFPLFYLSIAFDP